MRVMTVATVALLGCLFPYGRAQQQPLTPQQALARILQQSPAQADWFAPKFLAQIPVARIDAIVQQYTAALGRFQRAEATADGFTVVMEHGTAEAKIHLDEQGRIDGLWFGAPQTDKAESLDDIMKEMGGLPGKVSALVLEDGKPLASVHPDEALGVGSAFKLAILAAAQEQVAGGKRRLDEVHPLDKKWKSLPSGSLQNWPDGTPLTVATLENQMISMSDNTAADGMLSIVGRGEAQKFAPGNKPFLSTREAFVLKARTNEALLDRYRKADENGRRAMLAEIDTLPLPDLGEFSGAAQATDIEWFFTANEMCALMAKVADADAMHINPGLAKAAQWKQIAFKGGSEGGVLNLTTGLTGKNGRHYCVVATWNNNAPLEQEKLFAIYGRLLNALAKTSAQ
jgi:beta-lactamase class A